MSKCELEKEWCDWCSVESICCIEGLCDVCKRERERMSDVIVVKTKPCSVCNEYEVWSLDRELVDRWRGGENIQEVFPNMSAGEREVLITGTHPACWDKLFPEEEEGENENN